MASRKKTTPRKTASKKQASKTSASRKPAAKKNSASRQNSRAPRDALALLRADHAAVKALFQQYEKTRSDDRKTALAEQICNELTAHAQIEEEIFYPATREVLRQEDLVDEAAVEHNSLKWLIAQIKDAEVGEAQFDAKIKVLSEYVDHHVKEEQNEMFPQIKKTRLDLRALGEQLQTRKTELMGGNGSSTSSQSAGEKQKQAGNSLENDMGGGNSSRMSRGMSLPR
jgi:hemerythrin-like domain-containing protein